MKAISPSYRAHDYAFLVRRWQALAKRAGLKMRAFAKEGEHSVFAITTQKLNSEPKSENSNPGIYMSAGVHGDEPAPVWALLQWAEENITRLQEQHFLIFPCMNPHGLINNTRVDHRGVDLNRTFQDAKEPLIGEWMKLVSNRCFAIGLHLHEDFDGHGIYLYELNHKTALIGHRILEDCSAVIPIDQRAKMDGRKADRGLIVRRRLSKKIPGLPEAIALYHLGAPVALTFESPSEFSLTDRISVQKRFVESALHHVCGL